MSEKSGSSTVSTATSRAQATWEGDLTSGAGRVQPASGAFPELPVSWARRIAPSDGATSPEELLAAAHAACFSMALSNVLAKASHKADRLSTGAEYDFVPGSGITQVRLTVRGRVTGVSAAEFQGFAEDAKRNCPVSKALSPDIQVSLEAALEG